MGKNRKVPAKVTPRGKAKSKNKKKAPVIRRCAKCLERHEIPTGKRCNRLQTPGLQVGTDPLPGPPGLFRASSSAESVSAEEVRLAASRFSPGSTMSGSASTPQRPVQYSQEQPASGEEEEEYDEGDSDVFESNQDSDSGQWLTALRRKMTQTNTRRRRRKMAWTSQRQTTQTTRQPRERWMLTTTSPRPLHSRNLPKSPPKSSTG